MPVPPPPPPPPPPAAPGPPPPPPPPGPGKASGGSAPVKRDALFSDIQQGGFKLKKASTNDRSAPLVTKPKEEPAGAAAASAGGGGPQTAKAAAGPVGLGGLFAGGIPKLRPANAKANNTAPQPAVNAAPRPPVPVSASVNAASSASQNSRVSMAAPQPVTKPAPAFESNARVSTHFNNNDDDVSNGFSAQKKNNVLPSYTNVRVSTAENASAPPIPMHNRKVSAANKPPPPPIPSSAGPPPIPSAVNRPDLAPGTRNGPPAPPPPLPGNPPPGRPFAPPPPPPSGATVGRNESVLMRNAPQPTAANEEAPPPVPERRSMRPQSTVIHSGPPTSSIASSGSAMNLHSAPPTAKSYPAPPSYGAGVRQSSGPSRTAYEDRFIFRQEYEFPIPQIWNSGVKNYPSRSRKNQQRMNQIAPAVPPPPIPK